MNVELLVVPDYANEHEAFKLLRRALNEADAGDSSIRIFMVRTDGCCPTCSAPSRQPAPIHLRVVNALSYEVMRCRTDHRAAAAVMLAPRMR